VGVGVGLWNIIYSFVPDFLSLSFFNMLLACFWWGLWNIIYSFASGFFVSLLFLYMFLVSGGSFGT
jgi:hypothetical protein